MKTVINGRLIVPDSNGDFKIVREALTFDEEIISIGDIPTDTELIDAQGLYVAPGFINIHIHGAAGVDTMDDDLDALKILADFLPKTGVTSFLPTTMTMPLEKIYRALNRIRDGKKFSHGAKILGAHLEGPFINKKFNGAQAEENILSADFSLIEPFADVIKIVTFAPEECGIEFVDRCREKNIVASIGHSAATYDEAKAAINRGAKHITHLFNAQTGLHHRKPGIVGAAFDSNAIVELIADNVHVHPSAQRVVAKCKPRSEIILITDSIRACGIGDGVSELGGQKVFVDGKQRDVASNGSDLQPSDNFNASKTCGFVSELGGQKVFVDGKQRDVASNGSDLQPSDNFNASKTCGFVSELGGQKVFVDGNRATLADGTLVGSVAPMNQVVKNFRDNTNWNVAQVVELVTKNPAIELGIYDKLGSLEVGKAADIVFFDDKFNVTKTFVGGKEM